MGREEETRDGRNTKQREEFEGWRKVVLVQADQNWCGLFTSIVLIEA